MAIGIVFAKARDLADWVGRLAVGDDFTEYVLPHLRDLSKMTGIAYAGWVLVAIGIASLIWINAGHRLSDWWRARGALKRDPPTSKPADALTALSQPATVAVKGNQGLAILGLEEKVQPSRSDPPKVTLATYVNIKNTSTVTVPACKCTISYKELSLKGTVTNRVIGPLTLAAGEAKSDGNLIRRHTSA